MVQKEKSKKLIDSFFEFQQIVHDFFGYVEDWVAIPIEDSRDYFWMIDERSGWLRYAETKEHILDVEAGEYYEDEIYEQRFLPKYVYCVDHYTMVSVDTHTDGNKFLRILDNDNKISLDELDDE